MKIKLKRAADRPMETHLLSSHNLASSSTDTAITSLESEIMIYLLIWDSLLLQRRTKGDMQLCSTGCVGITNQIITLAIL